MKPAERQAANLRASLEFYGHATGRGTVEEQAGVRLIAAGLDSTVFNIALLTTPISNIEGELDRRIQLAKAWFRSRATGWSMWVGEEQLGSGSPRRWLSVFEQNAMLCIAESPAMDAPGLAAPARPLPELECRAVREEREALAFAELISLSFGIPYLTAQRIYARREAWEGTLHGFVGYARGEAVATTALVRAAGAVGIYSVSTRPGYRRKGYAEALMRLALRDFSKPDEPLVLQSSRAGLRMYQQMGFKRVTRFFIYATP
jgi:ribosomal protein S18 acetylase RimI-like enzyme